MAKKFLDYDGLAYLFTKIKTMLSGKADSNHTHSAATTSAAGFMSASDKSKLDGIATGANKITVDSALSSTSTNPVQNKVINAKFVDTPSFSDLSNFLSRTGDTMTGDLTISKANPALMAKDTTSSRNAEVEMLGSGIARFGNADSSSSVKYVDIRLNKETANTADLITLFQMKSGVDTEYRLYGEHNKPTLADIGAAAASHNHSAANITSGTLAVARGGTGVTANPSMLTNLGSTTAASVFAASPRPGVTGTLPVANGGTGATTAAAALTNLGAAAASHNHSASNITSGTLAAARGGTGQTSLQATRNAMGLGNTTGALPVANGGTGATAAAAALSNLGGAPINHNHVNQAISPVAVDLRPSTSAGHGGYLDFNYNSSDTDYTTRLIEHGAGHLYMNIKGVSGNHQLHTTYTKPQGTYSGNGSATSRTVNTGGIGNTIVVTSQSNSGYIALVTSNGAFIKKGTTLSGLDPSAAKFVDGVLTIATTDATLNASGVSYGYYVI